MTIKKEMFTPVLDWLDAGAPHDYGMGFHMSVVLEPDKEDFAGHHCGTVACIAGALWYFHKLKVPADPYQIATLVGMTPEQAGNLFYMENHHKDIWIENITPIEAAFAIRSMLETGEVKWP